MTPEEREVSLSDLKKGLSLQVGHEYVLHVSDFTASRAAAEQQASAEDGTGEDAGATSEAAEEEAGWEWEADDAWPEVEEEEPGDEGLVEEVPAGDFGEAAP